RGDPIRFVVIGFPFKMPNPLKTNRRCPDLGEAVFLGQMHRMTQAITGWYAPGARWTVLTEGTAFRHLLDIDETEVTAYRAGVEQLATGLGTDWIEFLDLKSVVESFPE